MSSEGPERPIRVGPRALEEVGVDAHLTAYGLPERIKRVPLTARSDTRAFSEQATLVNEREEFDLMPSSHIVDELIQSSAPRGTQVSLVYYGLGEQSEIDCQIRRVLRRISSVTHRANAFVAPVDQASS